MHLYLFAVWGKDKRYLYGMEDSNSFVGNTPFAYLHKKKNAKMVTIDVDLTYCFTFVHYVEEINKVKYRFLKNFTGKYIDENMKESFRTYSMYVRDLDINSIVDFTGLEKILLKQNLMNKIVINDFEIRVLKFDDAFNVIDNDIKYNQSDNIVRLM